MNKTLVLAFLLGTIGLPVRAADDAGMEFFEKRIRPVLVNECQECHSSQAKAQDKLKGGLLLDSKADLLRGGESGPAIVPGKPDESLLLDALNYESFEMPPQGQLKPEVIADFKKWIEMGAPDPRTGESAASPADKKEIDFTEARKHWSFAPPQKHNAPAVKQQDWVKRPLDAFVLKGIEAANLSPSMPAEKRTWLRRVTYDLVGLPPTPEDVQAFLADESPEAKSAVVERLLASAHFGEHWARMWLDIARYAEDQAHIVGDDTSLCYPNAWKYRDWVIQALNDDLAYDRFIRLQLAADLLEPDEEANRVALGFLGLGPKYYRRNSPEVMADEWEDRVDVVSRGLMGLTVACARCHDHKFDPIRTEDYYALAGVFASTSMFNQPLSESIEKGKNGEAKKAEDALHILKEGEPTDLAVYIRGDVNNKGEVVKRRFLEILDPSKTPFASGSGRLELANAIANPQNPLTARVIVNRVWGQYFGQPLVPTASNFGTLGEEPTHPELLDDLAVRFMDNGWSLKWLHREIVLSATYAQQSTGNVKAETLDPANRLLARMPRKRMRVEQWRDTVLAVSGRLDSQVGGESIEPQDPKSSRRTIYSKISRLELNRMLAMFDYPDPNTHSERRVETTTPLQKLFAMNSPFMLEQAEALAKRLIAEHAAQEDRIARAYELCYNRPPQEEEQSLAVEFFANETGSLELWTQYAQVLLAANELMFID
jgi:hypothetical protein